MDIDDSKIHCNIGYRQSVSFITFLIDLFGEDRMMQCVMSTGLTKSFEMKFNEIFSHSLEHYENKWRDTLNL